MKYFASFISEHIELTPSCFAKYLKNNSNDNSGSITAVLFQIVYAASAGHVPLSIIVSGKKARPSFYTVV